VICAREQFGMLSMKPRSTFFTTLNLLVIFSAGSAVSCLTIQRAFAIDWIFGVGSVGMAAVFNMAFKGLHAEART